MEGSTVKPVWWHEDWKKGASYLFIALGWATSVMFPALQSTFPTAVWLTKVSALVALVYRGWLYMRSAVIQTNADPAQVSSGDGK